MKYTETTLRNAIYKIIPSFKIAVDKGVNLSLPEMVKTAAYECFLNQEVAGGYPWTYTEDFDYQVAQYIVREAGKDLKNKFFDFGTEEYLFKESQDD